jgi:outer membrane protein assembly factor BamB
MRRRLALTLLILPLALASVVLRPALGAAVTTLWPMYHLDHGRGGNDTGEPSFRQMSHAWTAGPLDGRIFAEPLVDGNSVIVVTENDSVYAFDVASGAQQWHTNLGAPRTSFSGCGDIMPLGITGTPVIDGGALYVVAEVNNPPSSRFNLAKLNPSNGGVYYNNDITPAGMDTTVEQERSALNVSNGNVVIVWGGLFRDCGAYHGFVETVSESTGVKQAQYNNTPAPGSQGGMWAPSGPAVDGAGNIYVSAGNGSSISLGSYDYSDSVLKFSPSLGTPSFFAPGPPHDWTSLNASDQDIGSAGPELLPNGLLFAIGKGGWGYLLNQGALPNNSNPGGGANADAQVCHHTMHAAFGGLAVAGNMVYVPCEDGIAAVSIDSSNAFHTVWYSAAGSGPPILAGGLIWSTRLFGGLQLYGLDPASGGVAVNLGLPQNTEHFATPAAGGGRIFVGDGTDLVAFVSPGAPAVPVPPPAPTPTPKPTPSPTPSPTPTPSASSTAHSSGSASASSSSLAGGGPGSHSGFPTLPVVVAVVLVVGGGGGAVWWFRFRRPPV